MKSAEKSADKPSTRLAGRANGNGAHAGAENGAKAGAIPLEQIVQANQKTFAAATRMNAKLMREMLRVQQHMLGFVTRRLESDIAAAEALARCGDGPEVMAVAQEFCAKAMADYAEEATELMRIGTEAAQAAQSEAGAATATSAREQVEAARIWPAA